MSQIEKWVAPGSKIPMTCDGINAPKAGEIFCNPDMARVLRTLGDKGATDGFYNGITGQAIVDAVQKQGGVMTMRDLTQHASLFPTPLSAQYRHVNLWQVPPNGQGVAGLVALSGLHHLEESGKCPKITPDNIDGAAAYHVQMELMRLGFKDAREHVACPDHMQVTDEWLLDTKRIGDRAATMFDPNKAVIQGEPLPSSCTVSFQIVDKQGNAVSFVNRYVMDLIITCYLA
jgi:gamma-glutamyltranspeptidase/glutathione hydrolase